MRRSSRLAAKRDRAQAEAEEKLAKEESKSDDEESTSSSSSSHRRPKRKRRRKIQTRVSRPRSAHRYVSSSDEDCDNSQSSSNGNSNSDSDDGEGESSSSSSSDPHTSPSLEIVEKSRKSGKSGSSSSSSSSQSSNLLKIPDPAPMADSSSSSSISGISDDKSATIKKEEKRQRRKRHGSQKTYDRISRAMHQRLYLVNEKREGPLHREYVVLGSTGNVYNVSVGHLIDCDCPDSYSPCKHMLFVLLKVLRVPRDSELVYQNALLTTELTSIFDSAPQTVFGSVLANSSVRECYSEISGESTSSMKVSEVKQRSLDGAECPICMEDLEEGERESIVWCRAQCGQNIHEECFDTWANQKRSEGESVCCMYCRTLWEFEVKNTNGDSPSQMNGVKHNEGYVNLGAQQGQSSYRDSSSYNYGWGYRHRWY